MILGRAVPKEYLAIATIASTVGGAVLLSKRGKKEKTPTTIEEAKRSIPINAGSRCAVWHVHHSTTDFISFSEEEELYVPGFFNEHVQVVDN